jgi:hypothetical protein
MKIIDQLVEQNIFYNIPILNQDLVPLKMELVNKKLFSKNIKKTFNSIKSLVKEKTKQQNEETINKINSIINNKLLMLNTIIS